MSLRDIAFFIGLNGLQAVFHYAKQLEYAKGNLKRATVYGLISNISFYLIIRQSAFDYALVYGISQGLGMLGGAWLGKKTTKKYEYSQLHTAYLNLDIANKYIEDFKNVGINIDTIKIYRNGAECYKAQVLSNNKVEYDIISNLLKDTEFNSEQLYKFDRMI